MLSVPLRSSHESIPTTLQRFLLLVIQYRGILPVGWMITLLSVVRLLSVIILVLLILQLIQWYVREHRIGYIVHDATNYTTSATAGPGYLEITYPILDETTGAGAKFGFYLSHFDITPHAKYTTMTDLPNLRLEISGNVNTSSEQFIFDFNPSNEFYSFYSTFTVQEGFTGHPTMIINITEYPTNI
jgi:hypothetical protein